MKDLLSKEHYCYKIYTSLMKTGAYLFFYRQLTPSKPTPIWLYGLPPIFTEKSWSFLEICHISKGGGGSHYEYYISPETVL